MNWTILVKNVSMIFLIADTFQASLARLTAQEQKAVKTTAFDLQLDPSNPGMRFHRLDRARDPDFWSVRVNDDIRIIVHKTASTLMLAYTDHHDQAYRWAERRRLERHPTTGAAQLVEIRERVEEVVIQRPVVAPEPVIEKPLLFDHILDEELLSYGVPPDWLEDVRRLNEDTLLDIGDKLPQEASEALLTIAAGGTPVISPVAAEEDDPFDHPDAMRRFRVVENVEELEWALEYPWEKWIVFLHPAQRGLVDREYSGPVRISGSAGTGKTIVALHRAVYLAKRHPESRVLLTTFSDTLANALANKLKMLVGKKEDVANRISVRSINAVAAEIYKKVRGEPIIASPETIKGLLRDGRQVASGLTLTDKYVYEEWLDVADAWGINTWEEYRDLPRLGRKTRIGGRQREALWSIFQYARDKLQKKNQLTWPQLFQMVAVDLRSDTGRSYDYAVVDECQDMGVAEIRFLAALGAGKPEGLFFTGDLGQRIFQQPFSWSRLGVVVRGRSHTLRINYRTSHQIRLCADRLLPNEISDVDGIAENRRGTVSVFNGPQPEIRISDSQGKEIGQVGEWINDLLNDGCQPHELGVFVRSSDQVDRAREAVEKSGANHSLLDDRMLVQAGHVSIGTMHLAKGLEFKAVVVMACDDEVIPSQERIENIADDSDLEEVYNTERHLLYVACTRARDKLLVSGVKPGSEFIMDMR